MDGKLFWLENRSKSLARGLNYLAGAALVLMMVLVIANVVLRGFGRPIWGSYEIIGFLGTVVISFALIHPTIHRAHMAVELIAVRLPAATQRILGIINSILVMVILGVISRQSYAFGVQVLRTNQVSDTLRMPFHPFLFGIAFAFAVATLVQLVVVLLTVRIKKN